MNIITSKDVFSDENQSKIPKKVERPRRRPRRVGGSATANSSSPSEIAPAPKTPTESAEPAKTVFYQASKPREGQAPAEPHAPLAPRPPQRLTNRSGDPIANNPNGGRFTTAVRRPDRNRLPQDTTANFMPSATARLAGASTLQPVQPRQTSVGNLKIIPLGGLEEIGKNMTVFEYGNDIFIVDMGFQFPDSDMFGVDYIIPDVSYLEDKKDKIRGVFITHGHLDHTGAIPYLIEKIGFPPMYGTLITMGMVKHRLEEFGLVGRNKLITVEPEKDVLQLGAFRVSPFRLIHSMPGAVGLEIETPNGRIAYCTDWKFDYSPAGAEQVDLRVLASVGMRGVDLLLSDSTNADKPGHSISEKYVEQALSQAIEDSTGRVIIAMFASNLGRIQQTLNAAAKHKRKVLVLGRSMQQNVEMAVNLKAMTIPPNTIISERELNRFNDNQVLVLSTGAQGEERSALVRMASGDHRFIKIKKGDTVVISASPIPGNEKSVNGVMDALYKAGAHVIYNKTLDVHSSGHAYQEDLKLMVALMRPQYFVPLHGERSKLILHGKLAEEVGVSPSNVIIGDNGLILEMDSSGRVVPTDNHVPAGLVMVDGLGVGDVGNIVLRDRQAMAQEGFFEFISVYDSKSKRFLNSPDIISRGFIYMRENEHFVNDIRQEIKRQLNKAAESKTLDINALKNELRDSVGKLLYEKTERQPMVIPVIIEV